jgi:DNA-binding beta-propeller fold protein YncE
VSLAITPAAYQLPAGISREVALTQGRNILIVGGLNRRGTTTSAVTRLNPVTGRTTHVGRLAHPTHDAAGAVLAGRPFVFGGGVQASVATVQALRPNRAATIAGRLPRARSDLSAVSLGTTAYLIGGYDGASYSPNVLATSNGTHFRVVARLPVPVRYAAVAGAGNRIWVLGGEIPAGDTSAIQQINLTTGKAAIVGRLPAPVSGATGFTLGGQIFIAGGQVARHGRLTTSNRVLSFRPGQHQTREAGRLPVPVANAAATVVSGTAFMLGGTDGRRSVPTVTQLRLAATPASAAGDPAGPADPSDAVASAPAGPASAPAGGSAAVYGSPILANAPWLGPPYGKGHLRPGSDPSVLPGDILIADSRNDRLLIVDPQGRIRWKFPRPGDLARGQTFLTPDDAFFSPNGRYIVATQEDNSVISVISIARHKIVYRYGTPGVPGSTPNHVSNPDDAMMMPGGSMIAADIKNCRILLLAPPSRGLHRPRRVIGGSCGHAPPQAFGSPNGAFPATDGNYVITEINGAWAEEMSLNGHVRWATHPPGVAYPSDTNEVYPGRYLTADYSPAGQVVEFNSHGRLLWRFGGLNHPSLALPLPNGDILVNDDHNDRVIVIDPARHRIVWQYGHTGVARSAPGYLNDPDGVELTPPDSMLITHAPTMGRP